MDAQSVTILGIHLDRGTFSDVVSLCTRWLSEQSYRSRHIVTVNPEFVMEAQRNEPFHIVINNADLRVTDGIGLVFGGIFLYGWRNHLHRATGVDLAWKLVELAASLKKRVYLVGARKCIAVRAASVLQMRFPLCTIIADEGVPDDGRSHVENEYEKLIKPIARAQPDILLVAFGSPRQDLWIARYLHRMPSVRIAMGVGGALDYIAGVVPRAPQWMCKLGFEWLYRLANQPHRLNRIITAVIKYPHAIIRQKMSGSLK